MARRDEKSVLRALGETQAKSLPAGRRVPQDCGDIGLKIGRDGTWYYRDSAIGRKPLVKLFASVLRQEKDGRYYLVTPAEKVLVHVEDSPFLAVGMTVEGSGKRQRLSSPSFENSSRKKMSSRFRAPKNARSLRLRRIRLGTLPT